MLGRIKTPKIELREKRFSIPKKQLIECGYERLENIYTAYQSYKQQPIQYSDRKTVLIAPSWGDLNIMDTIALPLIERLTPTYDVIVRPHPEYIKRNSRQFKKFKTSILAYESVTLDLDIQSEDSMLKADRLITDYSGIGFEYAFGTERPVLFIDCNKKIRNKNFSDQDSVPLEIRYRPLVSKVVQPSVDEILSGLLSLDAEMGMYLDAIQKLRHETVYNFMTSSNVAFNHILDVLDESKNKTC